MIQLLIMLLYYFVESELFDEMFSCELVLLVEFQVGSVVGCISGVEGLLCSLVLVEDSCVDEYDECNEVILQL